MQSIKYNDHKDSPFVLLASHPTYNIVKPLLVMKFCSEDAERLRLHTVAEAGDMDSLEKMVGESDSDSDSKDSGEGSASALGAP